MYDQEGLTAIERAPLDRLLVRLLLQEPDEDLLEVLARAGIDAPLGDADLDAAREEFTRLFLLPNGTPPYASAWLEGERERLGAQLSQLVSSTLAALGRKAIRREPWGNVPLDHLGFLLDLSREALDSDVEEDHQLGEHLLQVAVRPWVATFARALQREARVPLYRTLGQLLETLHGNDDA